MKFLLTKVLLYKELQHLSEAKHSFAESHEEEADIQKGLPTAFSNVDCFKSVHTHIVLDKHMEALESFNSNEERRAIWFNCTVSKHDEIYEVQYGNEDEPCHFALEMDYTEGDLRLIDSYEMA